MDRPNSRPGSELNECRSNWTLMYENGKFWPGSLASMQDNRPHPEKPYAHGQGLVRRRSAIVSTYHKECGIYVVAAKA